MHLTHKETEVVDLILEGMTYKEISSALNLSINTIKTYINNISGKRHITGSNRLLKITIDEFRRRKFANTMENIAI